MQKMQAIYPYLKQEFFLAWAPQDLAQEIEKIVAYFIQQNWMTEINRQLLPNLATPHELYALAELSKPSLNNFVLIQELLLRYSAHIPLNLKVLEKMTKTVLQRAAGSAQFKSAYYFDSATLKSFISTLDQQALLQHNATHISLDDTFSAKMAECFAWYNPAIHELLAASSEFSEKELKNFEQVKK